MALVAEAWPAAKRARVSSYVGLGWQSGVLAAALVTPLLLPVIGWRGMFLIGIFPAIAAYFIRFQLDEPDVFIANKTHAFERRVRAAPACSRCRHRQDQPRDDRALLGAEFWLLRHHIWLPNYLSTRFGYGLTQSALWTAVTIAGMALGIFVFGDFADRFGRRPAFLSYMLGAAVMVVVYSRLVDRPRC